MKKMITDKKESQSLGMPWEKEYGYAQAVKKGDTAWLAGQVGHTEQGVLLTGMEAQVRQSYVNIKKLLAGFDMNMDDVVEEVLYVLDIDEAFNARKKIGREFYPDPMGIPSTLIQVSGLALPGQLIEIKIIAKQ
ncbi:MAG: Rid family hydrolase [Ferruginibacter sp.]